MKRRILIASLACLASLSPMLSQDRDPIRFHFEWIETGLDDLHALLSKEGLSMDGTFAKLSTNGSRRNAPPWFGRP